MKFNPLYLFSILAMVFAAGCASNHPVVGAWREGNFFPTRTDKIALTLRPHPNAEDALLGQMLAAELKRENFDIVPLAEADYTLAYAVENDAVESFVSSPQFTVQTPPQSTREMVLPNGMPVYQPAQDGASSAHPAVYDTKGIRLYLYTNPQTHAGNFQIVWSGCIDAGERISEGREPLLIKSLLGYFGKDYNGAINLSAATAPESIPPQTP